MFNNMNRKKIKYSIRFNNLNQAYAKNKNEKKIPFYFYVFKKYF